MWAVLPCFWIAIVVLSIGCGPWGVCESRASGVGGELPRECWVAEDEGVRGPAVRGAHRAAPQREQKEVLHQIWSPPTAVQNFRRVEVRFIARPCPPRNMLDRRNMLTCSTCAIKVSI